VSSGTKKHPTTLKQTNFVIFMWKLPISQQFKNEPLPIMNFSGIQMIICNFLVRPELRDIPNFSYFHNDPVIKIPKPIPPPVIIPPSDLSINSPPWSPTNSYCSTPAFSMNYPPEFYLPSSPTVSPNITPVYYYSHPGSPISYYSCSPPIESVSSPTTKESFFTFPETVPYESLEM
jgi:hypothetical protein